MRTLAKLALALILGLASISVMAQPRDVILVLDNSGSMRVNDPARLSVAAVTDFIREQSPDARVGIVMFADSPRLLQPLTPVSFETRDQLLGALDALNFSGQWTDTASAIERALYELRLNGRDGVRKAIILVTDGIIDTGNGQRDIEKGSWLREQLAEDASRNEVRIFGIAFTENADYQLLQSLAGATQGEYFRALRARDLGSVLSRINSVLDSAAPIAAVTPATTGPDFVATPPSEPASETTTRPAERVVETQPEPAERQRIRMDGSDADSTASTADDAATDEDKEGFTRWRVLLIMLGLAAVGVVAASILWSEEIGRLLRRARPQAPEVDHGPSAVLYDVYDPSDIKRHEIGGKPVVIGRVSGSDPAMDYVVVDERTVGRWHATIERRGQSFWIRDEGSVNGTFVNDERVTSEHPLKHGDMVRVHRHEFEFVIPELFDSDRTMIANKAKDPDAMSTG